MYTYYSHHAFQRYLLTLHTLHTAGGARSVMVIVVGNRPGDPSSNPGRDF